VLKALSLWPAIGQYEKMPATGVPLAKQVASDIVLFGPVLNPGAAAGTGVFGWHGCVLETPATASVYYGSILSAK